MQNVQAEETVCTLNSTIRHSSDKHKKQGLNNIHVLQIALKSSNDRLELILKTCKYLSCLQTLTSTFNVQCQETECLRFLDMLVDTSFR